ncbi:ATP-binding cassette domain-containing protein [Paenibacillus sp. SYP-B3998]|uniref:ATP-binding cassette domain-containing protein n=1 Tax=Paenibacillus sp. SYP-B3998 TaxID=2678564 RepID=A0A6G4A4Q5_9BACL|nr:ATP-binding cassette domain-containing protein [Paenibacillus sp. SYP-B3998]NEW08801.1 ATP-binding cassette domain-containing protein [Paenibacillus sp. SYP-B3998]
MLEVKQVSKLYENERGVHNIDFSMQRGEIVGFLGPNGAGKTTTMRMITGYLNPTHGHIWVDGLSMADHPKQARRKIGYLPETPPLYPEMTVQAYLRFIANLRDVPAREQKLRVGEAIDKLGLQGREKQVIRSLSKGYKQRLGLAQAILHQPDLLILDEPTSGLDPKQIIEIRQLIHELGENHTVLLSTHILPEINAICNRVLIINQGRVVLDERPEHLGRTMGETFEVSLEVKGPRERILTELRGLEAVAAVKELGAEAAPSLMHPAASVDAPDSTTAIDSDEPIDAAVTTASSETVKLLVTSADRSDIREALFFHLAQAGYPILEMKRESLSLEDIFLKLTTDEPAEQGSSSEDEEEVAANA